MSVVVPAHDQAALIGATLSSVLGQTRPPDEVLVVDDGSTDGTAEAAARFPGVRVMCQPNRGAASATNAGVRGTGGGIVCLVDSDAVLEPRFLEKALAALEDHRVAAVGGQIRTANPSSLIARVMGEDLEYRYRRIQGEEVDHVSTCATCYRRSALERVGSFDERLAYGYDNDLSYRLHDAGFFLRILKGAEVRHHWRESLAGYLVQQYRAAYGRLQLVARHRSRAAGDRVSGLREIAQVPLTYAWTLALAGYALSGWPPLLAASLAALAAVALDRCAASLAVFRMTGDAAVLLAMPPVHVLRDLAWTWAMTVYLARRAAGREGS